MSKKKKPFLNEETRRDHVEQIERYVNNDIGPRKATDTSKYIETKFNNQQKVNDLVKEAGLDQEDLDNI